MPNINVRINENEKKEAEKVLKKIGMTASEYTRLSLKALVNEGGVPFPVTTDKGEVKKRVEYVKATMAMEGFELTPEDIKNVREIASGERDVEEISKAIREKYKEE